MSRVLCVQIEDKYLQTYIALKSVAKDRGVFLYKGVFDILNEHPDIKAEMEKMKNAK